MRSINPNKLWVLKFTTYKNLISFGFITLFIFIAFNLYKNDLAQDPWVLGDWLINFQDGGFKRRGISGSFFFVLQDFTGISLIYLVYTTQIILYALYFISFFKLLSKKIITPEFFLLIFSPLTLLFLINNLYAIGRKEIILIALFTLNALWNCQNKLTKYKDIFVFISLFAATLFHELVFFYIPYFILIRILHADDKELTNKNLKTCSLYFLSVVIPILLIYFFGTEIDNGRSFEIMNQRGIKINGGIFTFNENPINIIIAHKFNYLTYIISFFYGISLIILNTKKNGTYSLLYNILFSIIFSLPLFILAVDWGRWLFIHFTLMLVLFASLLKEKEDESQSDIFIAIKNKYYFLPILILNVTCSMSICSGFNFGSETVYIFKSLMGKFYEILPHTWL